MTLLRYHILMSPQVSSFLLTPLCSRITRIMTVLHTIRNRYAQHSIYTYSGIVLIAVNPFQRVTLYGPEIIQAYSGRRRGELEPHLFAIAEDAYTAMRKEGMGQTIIVSGER
jgi:myosin V